MKACPLCGSTYADRVDFCFKDGAPLVAASKDSSRGVPPSAPVAAVAAPASPPPADRPFTEAHTGPVPGLADESDLPEPAGLVARQKALASGSADLPAPSLVPASDDFETEEAPLPGSPRSPEPSSPSPDEEEDLAPAEALPSTGGRFSAPTLVPQMGEDTEEVLPGAVALDVPSPSAHSTAAPEAPRPLSSAEEDAFFSDGDSAFGSSSQPGDSDLDDPAAQGRKGVPLAVLAAVAAVLLVVGGVSFLGGSSSPESLPAETPPETPAATAPPVAPASPPAPEPEPAPDNAPETAPTPAAETAPEAEPSPEPVPSPPERPAATAPPPPQPTPVAAPVTPAAPAPEPAPAMASSSDASPWGGSSPDAGEAQLTISSKPSGAKVFVDGAAIGTTPVRHTVAYGSHEIRAELEGYRTASQALDAQAASQAVSMELQPSVVLGAVNILGVTGAQVMVDGNAIGSIPTIAQLSEGKHTFRVVPMEGAAFTRELDIRFPGPGKAFTVDLQP